VRRRRLREQHPVRAGQRIVPILCALVVSAGLAVAVPGSARGQDNFAVVVNTHDGLDLFRVAFKIVRTTQDVVDQSNAAVAANSCEDCSSTAIALQVVLIFSDPSEVTTTNLALAYNELCSACMAIAEAYQWVLTTGGVVHFTTEGNQRLAEIYRRLHRLRNAGLTLEQLQAELDEISAEIADVLATEIVPTGPPPEPPTTTTTTVGTTTAETTTGETTTTEPSTTTSP
jgi:hypothetical protein